MPTGSSEKYVYNILGVNSRLDEMQAAVLSVKMKFLREWTTQRLQIANWYFRELKGVDDMILPSTPPGYTHVYHRFVVRSGQRDALRSHLEASGVATMVHYPIPPHLQPAYKSLGYRIGSFPITESLARTSLSLPLWPGMSEDQIAQVVMAVNGYWK